MISKHCFLPEWIRDKAGELGLPGSPDLVEKAIVALQLLGNLAESNLRFQFKGGTSLLLRLEPLRRLSVDIDIVTPESRTHVLEIVERISKLPPFTHFEHDAVRDRELPPKSDYRFYYKSARDGQLYHVFLDIVYGAPMHSPAEPIPIATQFIKTDRRVFVNVPDIDTLMGDKLIAFAPGTIGIAYRDTRTLDIVKQMFDVSCLFDKASSLQAVLGAYKSYHNRQGDYHHPRSFTIDQTLEDTLDACVLITQDGLKGAPLPTQRAQWLLAGVNQLQPLVINTNFGRDVARVAAGKVACVAAWMLRYPKPLTIADLRYKPDRLQELKQMKIRGPWKHLDNLRRLNIEAFHYWSVTYQTLNG